MFALLVGGSAMAQEVGITPEKVDAARLRGLIERSDAEIADAKKGAKAATWLKRGDTFFEVEGKPVNGLYVGMPELLLTASFGQGAPSEETIGGRTYKVYTYEHFKTYLNGDQVEFFVPTTVVEPAALDKAMESYSKAYEMDKKQSKKVAEGLERLRVKSVENAGAAYSLGDYKSASANFRRAYRASEHPSMKSVDTLSLYYAGMTGMFAQEFEPALGEIERAIAMGYLVDGDAYLMKFHGLYGLDRKPEALAALEEGMGVFPGNEELIDMAMRYYAENDGDASSMIPVVEKAIAENPDNVSLRQGLARVYDKLGQNDNAIVAIEKAVELAPDDFLTNYLHGLFIVKKGDALSDALGKMTITSSAQFDAEQKKVNEVFASALAPLEKAYALDPSEAATVELLKNLTFRLREDPAMNTAWEKYDALYREMDK